MFFLDAVLGQIERSVGTNREVCADGHVRTLWTGSVFMCVFKVISISVQRFSSIFCASL